MPGISDPTISAEVLEEAAKEVEKLLIADSQYAELSGKLKVASNSMCNDVNLLMHYLSHLIELYASRNLSTLFSFALSL